MGKLSLGLGLAVGYVLGARAGKEKYEQIKQAASGVMSRPEVQQAVGQAVEQARAVAPAPLQGTIDSWPRARPAVVAAPGAAAPGAAAPGAGPPGAAPASTTRAARRPGRSPVRRRCSATSRPSSRRRR